jgi:hypothetical protein
MIKGNSALLKILTGRFAVPADVAPHLRIFRGNHSSGGNPFGWPSAGV